MPGALAERHIFELDGGTLALDFVNTVSGLRPTLPLEKLLGYEDLVYWAAQVGLLAAPQAAKLHNMRKLEPGRAERAFKWAVTVREALHDVFLASIEHRPPPLEALGALNAWIASALSKRRIRPAGGGRFEAVFEDDGDPLAFLRPVAADAARLLESGAPVRLCAEAEQGRCGWLFLDDTKNHSRRFCTMKECGNRAKQRRHRERAKQA